MTRVPGAGRVRRVARRAVAALRRRSAHGLVLLYHRVAGPRFDPALLDVSPANFDAHLQLLARSAAVLPLAEFEDLRRRSALPRRAVAITFDDGYADNLHAAAPVLAARGLPATVFVTSGAVGASREFWWDDVERVAASPAPLPAPIPIAGVRWTGDDGREPLAPSWNAAETPRTARQRLYLELGSALRPLHRDARAEALDRLRAWAGVAHAARETHRALTRAELVDLSRRPGIAIGAHTVSHPPLSSLPFDEQERELSQSRADLREILGADVTAVAYPFGTSAEVSADTVRAARAAGFTLAMANEPAAAWRWSNRWRVPRVFVRDWAAEEFRARLDAWWRDA